MRALEPAHISGGSLNASGGSLTELCSVCVSRASISVVLLWYLLVKPLALLCMDFAGWTLQSNSLFTCRSSSALGGAEAPEPLLQACKHHGPNAIKAPILIAWFW